MEYAELKEIQEEIGLKEKTEAEKNAARANALSYMAQEGMTLEQIMSYKAKLDMNEEAIADIVKRTAAKGESWKDALDYAVDVAAEQAAKQNLEEIEGQAVSNRLDKFCQDIVEGKKRKEILTGFKRFDDMLGGGLYPGLYIVGAISSLGKTTFILQIADQLAKQGQDVLVFSLEMDSSELIAKSVSRITMELEYMEAVREGQKPTFKKAKSTRGVLDSKRYEKYSEDELELIDDAIETYRKYASHLYIKQGIGNVSVLPIKNEENISIIGELERYKRVGKKPIIIIDYLQLLAPQDIRATDKQNMDRAVMELKRLSRDYGTPIIAISSLNRASYTDPVNMAAFKESGAIEYSSDVLIGLQFDGMDFNELDSTEKDRIKRVRETIKLQEESGGKGGKERIQVKILKNRNGTKGSVYFDFWPIFNKFEESRIQGKEDGEQRERKI